MLEDIYEPQNDPIYEEADSFLTYIKVGLVSLVVLGVALGYGAYKVLS